MCISSTYRSFFTFFWLSKWFKIQPFFLSGHEAVLLFFVLSGFLITYGLLSEQKQTEKIDLRNFYLGRFLRIAPLQFLTVFISFIMYLTFYGVIPSYQEPAHPVSTFLLLLLIPNITSLIDHVVNAASHIWSLGVENEFYLFWPLLLIRFRKSKLTMIISVILIKIIIEMILLPLFVTLIYSNHLTSLITQFLYLFPIEQMAVGGCGAWLVINDKQQILKFLFHPITQLITYLTIGWLIYRNLYGIPHYIETFIVPLIFLSLIINVSCNPKPFFSYENRLLNYLGKISYGIYMFHPSIAFVIIWCTYKHVAVNSHAYIVYIYLFVLSITIGIAGLSHKYLEVPIMKLRRKRAHVDTSSTIAFSH